MKATKCIIPLLALALFACAGQEDTADASGNFEADEVIVSAESQGRILHFAQEEGATLVGGEQSVLIDTTQLYLQKLQLESGRTSLDARIRTLRAQVRASRVQLDNLRREKKRIDKMVEGGAATSKQQDDIEGQISLLEAQMAATESQEASVHAERRTLEVQIRQLRDKMDRCTVRNPMDGIMLTKYRHVGEMAAPGQALYKMAALDELILRAYVSGDQLSELKVGAQVRVFYDSPGGMSETTGTVSWISSRAEFTPKIIQTREERVNLVYAVKVLVANDGSLKIGMPGEIRFK
jgi:HlyD family secretion protein